MEMKQCQQKVIKRPRESGDGDSSGGNKRPSTKRVAIIDDDEERVYNFRVLLPNGTTLGLRVVDPAIKMPVVVLVDMVKHEYFRLMRQTKSQAKRRINWKGQDLCFLDSSDSVMKETIDFNNYQTNKQYFLRLHDGSREAETYENMWDLTPDTDLLKELPEEYTFETAIADLIDNSLQAVWANRPHKRRLLSVEIVEDKISIFDTGPGMDGSEEHSIVKWGKMGASLHRSSRGKAIGGKPPYLKPFFGMFGYGGPIASMHLGRRALVSSKTKESKKVYTLFLERDALLSSSGTEHTWRTDGGLRDPSEDEIQKAPDGSFTKVEICKLKIRSLDTLNLPCKLKDIYFPYIQCDEVSNTGRTIRPVEFQVNGIDLAEIEGGEVATTNLHSCNGPEFVVQLRFYFNQDTAAVISQGLRAPHDANARLKCVYFPIVEGKENIQRILEKLEQEGCGITESYESFSHVSIRRLGRLLPDARWAWLPFMEPRQRKGDRAQVFKRCCPRVKCFIDTDAGFNPTPSKTDLAHHHPYTTALKNFGNKPLEKEKEVHVEIYKDGKQITIVQMEKQYQEWILQMHDYYDEEIDCGEDEPILIVNPLNKKGLGISSDVVRIHKVFRRKSSSWKSGQQIKIQKGACAGCHKKNIYAILECIVLEGIQGDAGGEARLICRPLDIPEEKGYLIAENNGIFSIDIRSSISLPVSVIDSGKCLAVSPDVWNLQLEKQLQKSPSKIDILSMQHCLELEVEGVLPLDATIDAGHVPSSEIVAVVRPASFTSAIASKNLDQKHIVKEEFEMTLEIKFMTEDKNLQDNSHICSQRVLSSTRKGFHGLYIFPLRRKLPDLFQKAGVYTFLFSLGKSICRNYVKTVHVKALSQVERWGLLGEMQSAQQGVRVGSCFPPFDIACYDRYNNRTPFTCVPQVMVKIRSNGGVLLHEDMMRLNNSSNKLILRIEDLMIESGELDKIRPNYEAKIMICSQDEVYSVAIPCQVMPGSLQYVTAYPTNFTGKLLPGHVIKELVLEMFDAYGNHVKEGEEILLNVDGFCFQDKVGCIRKVDDRGCISLSGLLKVTKGWGKTVSLSILSDKRVIFKEESQIEKRELRVASTIPMFCIAGSQLENLVFEIINSSGDVDESMHYEETCGLSNTLILKSETMDVDDSVHYSFIHGRCTIRTISLPPKDGIFSFVAAHSLHQEELQVTIEVHVKQVPKIEYENIHTQWSDGETLLLRDSPTLKTQVECQGIHDQYPDGTLMVLPDSSASKDVVYQIESILNAKELEDEFFRHGLLIGEHEKKLEMLRFQQEAIEQDISNLQASVDPILFSNLGHTPEKEVMLQRIECRSDTAAAVVCKIFREGNIDCLNNILGVVALLGIVQTNELSRILAEYLSEEQMLAVVCKSYTAACELEKYEGNSINHARGLPALAAELGISLNGRYVVICLEDIRPYDGAFDSDPQRKLLLPMPTLPNGESPPGYKGYAVNMIYQDVQNLHTRTAGGHGLRETLFYRLFGELQVYETREYMNMAQPYIHHGAVSLDGGIMRGNGIIILGDRDPYIRFPVVTPQSQPHLSPHCMHILMQFESQNTKLSSTIDERKKRENAYKKDKKRYIKKRERYKRYLALNGLRKSLECGATKSDSNNTPL